MNFTDHTAKIDSTCPCELNDIVVVKTKSIDKFKQPSKTYIHGHCLAKEIDWTTAPVIGRVVGYCVISHDDSVVSKWAIKNKKTQYLNYCKKVTRIAQNKAKSAGIEL